jgi:hypothetical protein
MGGRTAVEQVHGGVLFSRVLTDHGLAVVRSTASSRCGDHGGALLHIFYQHKAVVAAQHLLVSRCRSASTASSRSGDHGSALLRIFYPHNAVVATPSPSARMAAQHLLVSRRRSTTASPALRTAMDRRWRAPQGPTSRAYSCKVEVAAPPAVPFHNQP